MLWTPAVFGGLGVLALGLLVSTVVGPRWGPLGALGTALCFPLLHVNRSTYSEPPAVLVLAAGLLVLAAATAAGSGVPTGTPASSASSPACSSAVAASSGSTPCARRCCCCRSPRC